MFETKDPACPIQLLYYYFSFRQVLRYLYRYRGLGGYSKMIISYPYWILN